MGTKARELALRWLLLATVVFGVVAMHHLTADHELRSASSVMAGPVDHEPLPAPPGPHTVLHTCLAVLGGTGAMLALAVLFGLWWPASRVWTLGQHLGEIVGRSPPRTAGRALLSSVCVLRL